MVPNTVTSKNGVTAAWFLRSTHATVATTYVLKVKGEEPEWDECGSFQRIQMDGNSETPILKIKDSSILVVFRAAEVFNFSNRTRIVQRGTPREIKLLLREQGEEPARNH
jgi:hypothetical protein